jgi:hypothetical protein
MIRQSDRDIDSDQHIGERVEQLLQMRNNAGFHGSLALDDSNPFTAAAIDARNDSHVFACLVWSAEYPQQFLWAGTIERFRAPCQPPEQSYRRSGCQTCTAFKRWDTF